MAKTILNPGRVLTREEVTKKVERAEQDLGRMTATWFDWEAPDNNIIRFEDINEKAIEVLRLRRLLTVVR